LERTLVKIQQLHIFGLLGVFQTGFEEAVEDTVHLVSNELLGGETEEVVLGVVVGGAALVVVVGAGTVVVGAGYVRCPSRVELNRLYRHHKRFLPV